MEEWLQAEAAHRAERGLTRTLRSRPAAPASGEASAGSPVDLAGNDYLGLARHPAVMAGAADALRAWGAGATGSRLVTGNTAVHEELEWALADYCGQPSALVFSSGYLANLGVVTALAGPDCLVVSDSHNHASLIDACRLSRSRVVVTPHADVEAVRVALAGRSEARALVLTESVFSVLGDLAPLTEFAEVCAAADAVLVVDEAHGLGVAGQGRGAVMDAGLAGQDSVVVTVTMSKALGAQGGVVLGSSAVRNHLINTARAFIYDTGLAPPVAGAALAALSVLRDEPERVARVRQVAAALAAAVGVEPPAGAVLSRPLAGPAEALDVAEQCGWRGVRVGCFRPPSTPDGSSRLRLTASAALEDAALDAACDVLRTVLG